LYLSDPATKRREYPEVSFGVIQGIVLGLMGVEVLPGTRTVTTLYRSNSTGNAALESLPILGTTITVKHMGRTQSQVINTGSQPFLWRAMFTGKISKVKIRDRILALQHQTDKWGHIVSYTDITLAPGESATASLMIKPASYHF
jgi:hypothetical protein